MRYKILLQVYIFLEYPIFCCVAMATNRNRYRNAVRRKLLLFFFI